MPRRFGPGNVSISDSLLRLVHTYRHPAAELPKAHGNRGRKGLALTASLALAVPLPVWRRMQPSKPSRLFRWLPSMTDAAFVMPLVFLFCGMKGAQTLLGDGDTGWHLRTGEWILAHGRVPDRDIFSFTRSE